MGNAPARVRCNTCNSERNYRLKTVLVKDKETRPRIRATKVSSPDVYEKKLRDSNMKTPRPYRATEAFEEGDVIDHTKFGRGVVMKVVPPDRIDVLFRDESKTLLCKLN